MKTLRSISLPHGRKATHTTPGARAGHWHVTVTPAFETSVREPTDPQLAKAGYRLAEVLKKDLM